MTDVTDAAPFVLNIPRGLIKNETVVPKDLLRTGVDYLEAKALANCLTSAKDQNAVLRNVKATWSVTITADAFLMPDEFELGLEYFDSSIPQDPYWNATYQIMSKAQDMSGPE